MSNTEKKWNLKLSALWGTRYPGMYMSMPVDDVTFDALQRVEKGGKIVIKVVDESRRQHDKSPHAYIEYITKEDVEAFSKNGGGKGASKSRPAAANDDDGGV